MIKTSKYLLTGLFLLSLSYVGKSQSFSVTISPPDTVADGSVYGNTKPKIALVNGNVPVVIWGNSDNLDLFIARKTGTGFTTPVQINPDSIGVFSADWVSPNVATDHDTVFAVWEQTVGVDFTSWCAKSVDGGLSFSFPVMVDTPGNMVARYPSVTIVNGSPVVSYMKALTDLTNQDYYIAKSLDGGVSFENDVNATINANGTPCECCPGQIFSKDSLIGLIYRNNKQDHRDVSLALSENFATSFDTVIDVDPSNWIIATCPASGPRAFVGGDSIYCTFMTNVNPPAKVKFSALAYPDKTLGTFRNMEAVSPSNQNYSSINGRGDTLGVVWEETSAGSLDIWMNYSVDGGNGFQDSAINIVNAVAGQQRNADIVYANGIFHIAYQDNAANAVIYLTASIDGVASVKDNQKESFVLYPNPAKDVIYLKDFSPSSECNYSVIDIAGKELMKGVLSNEKNIRVENLNAGYYFLLLESKIGRSVVGFVKE